MTEIVVGCQFICVGDFLKRILPLLFSVLMLCGCGSKEAEVKLSGISFDADIRFGKYECSANMQLYENGESRVVLSSPSTVAGVELLIDGEGITVKYSGLTYKLQAPLPNETVNSVLSTILTSASSGCKGAREEKGIYLLENSAGGYAYKLYVTEVGLPIRLECEQAELYAEFSNISLKNAANSAA